MGINIPSRVCDRCYHDMGSALTDGNALTRSFVDDSDYCTICDNMEEGTPSKENINKESMTSKPKRSEVVDELVLRMPSMPVENCSS